MSEVNITSNKTINTIELFTLEGKMLKSIYLNKSIGRISQNEFNKGTYIIKLKFNDYTTYTKLLLKKMIQ